jgi:tripartite-type tricarboxylate transporter receptor subunit TctC
MGTGSVMMQGVVRLVILPFAVVLFAYLDITSPALAYPERPIRVIIPLPPGGAVDVVARLLQPPPRESAWPKHRH